MFRKPFKTKEEFELSQIRHISSAITLIDMQLLGIQESKSIEEVNDRLDKVIEYTVYAKGMLNCCNKTWRNYVKEETE